MENPEVLIILPVWLAGIAVVLVAGAIGLWWTFLRGRAKEPIPGWNAVMRDCPFDPKDVSQAMNAYVEDWANAFGQKEADKVKAMFDEKRLFGFLRFSIYFKAVEGKRSYILKWAGGKMKVAGHMLNKRAIVVAHLPDDSIGSIALFHEFTHPSLLGLHGAPDNNHAPPPGPWRNTHDAMIANLKSRFKSALPKGLLQAHVDHLKTLNEPVLQASKPYGAPVSPLILCGTCARNAADLE